MQPASGRVPAGPQILVLPFTDLGDGEVSALYSAALTDEVVTALGRFKEIAVLGVQTSRSLPPDPDMARLTMISAFNTCSRAACGPTRTPCASACG